MTIEPWPQLPTISIRIAEAVDILDRILDGMTLIIPGRHVGTYSSEVRRLIGDISANAEEYIADGTLGTYLVPCFEAVTASGTDYNHYNGLLKKIVAETPIGLPAIATTHLAQRLTLGQMVSVILNTEFTCREDADKMLARITAAFAPAIDDAADEHDPLVYRALVTTQAAVVRDLVDRSRLLPRIVKFELADVFPTLWISNHIYCTGSRADELRAENKVVHPAFVQPSGICLSR